MDLNGKKLKNDLVDALVDFENARLLKEAGFDVLCTQGYDLNDLDYERFDLPKGVKFGVCSNKKDNYVTAPTLQVALEWIRINYGFYITIPFQKNKYCFYIEQLPTQEDIALATNSEQDSDLCLDATLVNDDWFLVGYDTTNEAKQVAIKHTLTHLINPHNTSV